MASSQQQFNDAIYQDIVSKYKELSTPQSYDLDKALRDRAKAVLPSLTHLDVKGMMAPGYAQFFVSGKGARVTDVNKKEYIDYMCSYGPMLVGYNNPVVNEAIRKQLELGDVLTGPSPRMVELAELITETIPWADWCFFAKTALMQLSLQFEWHEHTLGKKLSCVHQGHTTVVRRYGKRVKMPV